MQIYFKQSQGLQHVHEERKFREGGKFFEVGRPTSNLMWGEGGGGAEENLLLVTIVSIFIFSEKLAGGEGVGRGAWAKAPPVLPAPPSLNLC